MMHPRRPVRVVAAVVAAAVLAVTGACAGPLGGQAVPAAEATPVAAVTSSPALDATDLSPVQPVTLSVAQGTISALTLTSPTGAEVKGTLSADRTSWTLAEPLGYGKTYTVTGTAMGSDGKAVPIQGSYSTVSPAEKMTSKISPGMTRWWGWRLRSSSGSAPNRWTAR